MIGKKKEGYIRVYILAKKDRIDKQKNDGIRLEVKSPNINIAGSNRVALDFKDWESLSIINGISEALIRKKLQRKSYKIL